MRHGRSFPLALALASLVGGSARGEQPTSTAAEEPVEEVSAAEVRVAAGPPSLFGESYPGIDRGVSLPLPSPVRRGAMVLVVDHRTNKPFTENTWHDYFGFDAGALKIGLGLRFGLLDGLDVGIYRLNSATERFDVYQWDARYRLLRQERHLLDLALVAGLTWFSQQDAEDAVGGLGQLLLARRLWERLTLASGLLFHSDSTNGVKSADDTDWSLAAMLLLDVRVLAWLSWNVEASYGVAGYATRDKAGLTGWPSFSSSVRFITHRHTFALVLTNNPYTSADGQVCNSPRGFDKLVVGFTITRQWNLW
jgi:hypothetical protein